jgi:hypothetical protein
VDRFAPVRLQVVPGFADGDDLDIGNHSGARFRGGVWLDPEESFGIEAGGFFLVRRSNGFNLTTVNSLAQDVFTFPGRSNVFVVTPGAGATPASTALRESFPTFVVRQAVNNVAGTGSTALWGADVNLRCASPSLGAVSYLVGFRYLDFHEDLNVASRVRFFLPPGFTDVNGTGQPLNTNLPADLSFASSDLVRTYNRFYGGQVGCNIDMYFGRCVLDFRAKAAVGVMHQTVNLAGNTTLPDGQIVAGGLLSSPGDQGKHSRDQIAFVPEINVKLGYLITSNFRAYVGYDFLYLASVVRPGDQTGVSSSTTVATVAGTTTQIAVTQPAFRFNDTDVWVNGINFGVELRY